MSWAMGRGRPARRQSSPAELERLRARAESPDFWQALRSLAADVVALQRVSRLGLIDEFKSPKREVRG
jgi:hypothetical protein